MISNYAQGWKNCKIEVRYQNGLLYEASFPECNETGFREIHHVIGLTKTDISFRRKNKIKGFHIDFILNYNQYITGTTLEKFKTIIDWWIRKKDYPGMEIIITPRVDFLDRRISVFYSGEEIELGVMKGKGQSRGNKHAVIQFSTVNPILKMDFIDPGNASFSIFNLTTQ